MINEMCFGFILVYYFVILMIFSRKDIWDTRFHYVLFPLPLAFFIGLMIYDDANKGDIEGLVRSLIFLSSFLGIGVLVHCYIDRGSNDPLFYLRIVPAIILIFNPLLLYYPDYISLMIGLFLFSGIMLGTYGSLTVNSGKRYGFVYVYISIIFMVIVPVIAFTIAKVYTDFVDKEILYRRTGYGQATCHAPYIPPVVPRREVIMVPLGFSSIYLAFIGILVKMRKWKLQKAFQRKGIIPDEFQEIIENGESNNGRS